MISVIATRLTLLQLVACLEKPDSVTLWSTSLDERALQTNARLLDISELGETMIFLSERINASDFTLAKATVHKRDGQDDAPLLNLTFTNPKNKQSITLSLSQLHDEQEKALLLSRILSHVYSLNEQLVSDVKIQQLKIKELSTKTSRPPSHSSATVDQDIDLGDAGAKSRERARMSLINPTAKRRKKATGVSYGDDDSD